MGPQHGLLVKDALDAMQAAIRSGNMLEARDIGNSAVVPLSLSAAELHIGQRISEGAESIVFKGTYHDQDVAIKRARITTSADLERFRSELLLLAGLSHLNIIPLLGARALPPDYMLVLPLAASNLRTMLYNSAWQPNWQQVVQIAVEIVSALEHLQEHGIIHRDIKPTNLLMDTDGHVCLSDFGIATTVSNLAQSRHNAQSLQMNGKPSGGFHKKNMVGSLEYMAPEVLLKSTHSFASDIYAFAITINELATGVYPFSNCTKDNPDIHTVLEMGYGRQELAAAVAAEGLRPLLPKHSPPGYVQLVTACWACDPKARPTISSVKQQLLTMQAALPAWQAGLAAGIKPSATAAAAAAGVNVPVLLNDKAAHHSAANGPTTAHVVAEATTVCMDLDEGSCKQASSSWLADDEASYRPVVTTGSCEAIGPRDTMEDRHFIIHDCCGRNDMHALAVFDGHRGQQAAEYAREHLPDILQRCCSHSRTPQEALQQAFLLLDQGYRSVWDAERLLQQQHCRSDVAYPGCTALVALVVGSKLFIANAGDSRAVLCRGPQVLALSRDHTVGLEDERKRIVAAGGSISWQLNSWRIGSAGLQVSRSIGDFDQKGHGVTAEPEVTEVQLAEDDHCLLLATDGLWDSLRNDEAAGLVADTVKNPDMCAKRLITEALARGSNDNITAIVAFLRPVSTLEQVYGGGIKVQDITPTHFGSRVPQQRDYAQLTARDEVSETL